MDIVKPFRVLVTGAAGFIGSCVAREFLARGAEVFALVHRAQPSGLDGARFIHASLDDRESLLRAVRAAADCEPIDAAVNCAGRANDLGADELFRRANYQAVLNLIACLDAKLIGRLVHISTTDVYGLRDFRQADETAPLRDTACNPYPKYKIMAERAIRQWLGDDPHPALSLGGRGIKGPPYVILRPAAVWGPGDRTILPRVLNYLRGTSTIVHFGKWAGRNRWPLAHVQTVARAAWLAATCDEALGQAYNVIDLEFTSVEEFFRLLIDIGLVDSRPRKSIALPFALGYAIGQASSVLSNMLGRDRPLFEPTLYGLYSGSCNLDFSGAKLAALFARHGERFVARAAGLAGLASGGA